MAVAEKDRNFAFRTKKLLKNLVTNMTYVIIADKHEVGREVRVTEACITALKKYVVANTKAGERLEKYPVTPLDGSCTKR